MTDVPSATVVICAYSLERWADLSASVASVLHQTKPAAELVVVIDRNEELLARAAQAFGTARVTANDQQGGISGARNTGIAQARSEIVVFLDDDALAEPDWLERLLAPYADPVVLGVGGRIVPLWRFGRPEWFPSEFNWVVGCSYTGLPERRARVRNPIGANLSARRTVLLELDGFDHTMGRVSAPDHATVSGTADETELCIRATQRWPERHWIYEPAAIVHHVVPSSRLSFQFFVERCQMEGGAKALLRGIAGPAQSLASEQTYVRTTLPRGVARELRAAARGECAALGRAAAICAGLTITAASYVRTRAALALRR